MAMDYALYLVSEEIAIRSGVIESRYRVSDGRFVLDSKDLSRIRFTIEEYIHGLDGVEMVDAERAKTLISANGNVMGLPKAQEQTVAPVIDTQTPDNIQQPEESEEPQDGKETEGGENENETTEE